MGSHPVRSLTLHGESYCRECFFFFFFFFFSPSFVIFINKVIIYRSYKCVRFFLYGTCIRVYLYLEDEFDNCIFSVPNVALRH